jgi:hypothetical protein
MPRDLSKPSIDPLLPQHIITFFELHSSAAGSLAGVRYSTILLLPLLLPPSQSRSPLPALQTERTDYSLGDIWNLQTQWLLPLCVSTVLRIDTLSRDYFSTLFGHKRPVALLSTTFGAFQREVDRTQA